MTNETAGASMGLGQYCPYCSHPPHSYTYHHGPCPRVKAIEYYPNGTIKRVEFVGDSGYVDLVEELTGQKQSYD